MKISRGQGIAIGTLIFLLGIIILASQYLLEKKNTLFDTLSMQLYFNQLEEPEVVETPPVEVEEPTEEPVDPPAEEPEKPQEPVITENFIAVLEIPKIELKKGLYQIGSKYNTVSRNVAILTPSDYPDVEGGNFVLAAHSGNGYLSFFKNLYKLSAGDYAYIYYNNNKYTYKITYIYYQPKVGTINVYRPYGKTTLMMITCTKDDESSQTVYVAELESVVPSE